MIWLVGNVLKSNNGVLENINNGILGTLGVPRITTNFTNQRDLYLTWSDGYNLNGGGSTILSAFMQDLYP